MSAGFLISEFGVANTAQYFQIHQETVLAYVKMGATSSDDIYRLKNQAAEFKMIVESEFSGSPVYLPNGTPQPKKEKSQWGRKWF